MKKIILIALTVLLGLSLYLIPKLCQSNGIDIEDKDAIIHNISQLNSYTSVRILKEKMYKDYYAVLFCESNPNPENTKKDVELAIYKKMNHPKKYYYYGGASSTKEFDTYNCNEKGLETIIIVYGNNQPINTSSYRIKTVQKSFEKDIQSDLVLDIYIIYGTDSCSTVNELLDLNGEIITMF